MTAFVVCRIKKGAGCFQDHGFFKWPGKELAEECKKEIGVEYDCLFIGEKDDRGYWCDAPGAGWMLKDGKLAGHGTYGNGSIHANDVEVYTPMVLNREIAMEFYNRILNGID